MMEDKVSIYKFAMSCGTLMGVYWIFQFIFLLLAFTNGVFNLIFIALAIGVPFLGYRMTRIYRDRVCGGAISFLQSWVFMVFMFMFASLLAAAAYYIYFRLLDNGFVINQMTIQVEAIANNTTLEQEVVDLLNVWLDSFRALTPIEIAMQTLSQNFVYCSLLSLVIAPFVKKTPTA